jgi:S1-C subfamily serine protease
MRKTPSLEKLFEVLETYKIGDEVTVAVLREGERKDVKVTLQKLQ